MDVPLQAIAILFIVSATCNLYIGNTLFANDILVIISGFLYGKHVVKLLKSPNHFSRSMILFALPRFASYFCCIVLVLLPLLFSACYSVKYAKYLVASFTGVNNWVILWEHWQGYSLQDARMYCLYLISIIGQLCLGFAVLAKIISAYISTSRKSFTWITWLIFFNVAYFTEKMSDQVAQELNTCYQGIRFILGIALSADMKPSKTQSVRYDPFIFYSLIAVVLVFLSGLINPFCNIHTLRALHLLCISVLLYLGEKGNFKQSNPAIHVLGKYSLYIYIVHGSIKTVVGEIISDNPLISFLITMPLCSTCGYAIKHIVEPAVEHLLTGSHGASSSRIGAVTFIILVCVQPFIGTIYHRSNEECWEENFISKKQDEIDPALTEAKKIAVGEIVTQTGPGDVWSSIGVTNITVSGGPTQQNQGENDKKPETTPKTPGTVEYPPPIPDKRAQIVHDWKQCKVIIFLATPFTELESVIADVGNVHTLSNSSQISSLNDIIGNSLKGPILVKSLVPYFELIVFGYRHHENTCVVSIIRNETEMAVLGYTRFLNHPENFDFCTMRNIQTAFLPTEEYIGKIVSLTIFRYEAISFLRNILSETLNTSLAVWKKLPPVSINLQLKQWVDKQFYLDKDLYFNIKWAAHLGKHIQMNFHSNEVAIRESISDYEYEDCTHIKLRFLKYLEEKKLGSNNI